MITNTVERFFNQVTNESSSGIKPLPFWSSLIAFGAPALLMVFSYHIFMPRLIATGLSSAESFAVAHIVPMAVLLAVSLHMFHNMEGRPLTWTAFSKRFRYPRLTLKVALLGIGTFVALNIVYGLFSQSSAAIINLEPTAGAIRSVSDVLDPSVQGQWQIILLFVMVLAFNVIGEELWWRGIILPRQELIHGRWTWIVHGLLWTSFHVFKWWDLVGLLPICLIIAFISQRTQNNWPALIAHLMFNGMALFLVVSAVMG